MKTLTRPTPTPSTATTWNWPALAESLDTLGYAVTPPALSPTDCAELVALYDEPHHWQQVTTPDRYRLGPGEYKRFNNPLPEAVAALRNDSYPQLARIANAWQEKLNDPAKFPAELTEFQAMCRNAHQPDPMPVLVRHNPHEYHCLHQDTGEGHVFPLQMALLLSKPNKDHQGGEFLLVENHPRAQSRGRVVPLKQGQAVIWPANNRPATGNRGHYRVNVRYGVSTVLKGTRYALGLITTDT
jgi:hypothetical protein